MFTIRKLESLPAGTRRRKIERLLYAATAELEQGRPVDLPLLSACLAMLVADRRVSEAGRERIAELAAVLGRGDPAALRRALDTVRCRLLLEMGAEPSEWDLVAAAGEALDLSRRRVFPFRVYLEDIRSPFNVGSVFRTAECFGVREILLSPDTPRPSHPRALKTARGTTAVVPWRVAEPAALADDRGLFALELGGAAIGEFVFPDEGTVILGSEELGVSPEGLAMAARARGRVSIPLYGAKQSLNVSVAFGILMQAWSAQVAARSPSAGSDPPGRRR